MFENIKQYIIERAKWRKSGKPLRTPERIEQLFKICSSNQCLNYISKDIDRGECNICHCNLLRQGNYFNKLAWGTTRCPLEHPLWVEENVYQIDDITSEDIVQAEQEHNLESAAPAQEIIPEQVPAPFVPPPARGGCGCG